MWESKSTIRKAWYEVEVKLSDGTWNRRYFNTNLEESQEHLAVCKSRFVGEHRLLKVEAECEVIG